MLGFYTYILYSEEHDIFYVGYTHDLSERINRHNRGDASKFTAKFRPWMLFFSFSFPTREIASKAESYLKKKNKDFIYRIPNDEDLQKFILQKFNP